MKDRLAAVLKAPAHSAAILVVAGAVVSLVGYAAGSKALQALFLGSADAGPASAFCFLFLGVSLWFLRPPSGDFWHRWGPGARLLPAFGVMAYAGLHVLSSLRESSRAAAVPAAPGGVHPNAAICFVLIGLALLVMDPGNTRRVARGQLLCLGAGAIALAALLAGSYEDTAAGQMGAIILMPPASSIGILLLAAGFLMERFEGGLLEVTHSDSAGGVMARRFLPAAILIPPLLGYLCWHGKNLGLYSFETCLLLFALSNIVVFCGLVVRTALSLHVADRERQRAQNALQQANEMLTEWVRELEVRNKETLLLNEMGDRLQTCLTTEEACAVITKSALQLFPNDSGALFVTNASKNLVEVMAVWGGFAAQEPVFPPESCWALRSGRVHRVDDPTKSSICAHVRPGIRNGYLCVPMVAQGEAIGVLHLEMGPPPPDGRPVMTDAKNRLALSVSDHLGLALASLRLRETLHIQSIRDPLTGLFNRRYMEESLERELRRADRKQRPLAALMLDLDHFKRFNDTLGHAAGDAALRSIGNFLQSRMRKDDIVCRYGGEEFTIIMPESSLEIATQRAERLREDCKRLEISLNGQFLGNVTFSVGIACFPDHGTTAEQLLHTADLALYRAKAAGRDCVMAGARPTETAAH
ncbi:MAG TPA: sensor domain-containing diguanylate cyclase [Candidatus Acidoferrales bacterium]|nr:sensor domain-containing diguanylate cyclase [Candidatus Acidoferrales bacterium]